MDLFKKLRGIIGALFQIDVYNDGPQLKNNSGVLEFRNANDNGFVVARGATPLADNDLVNKLYADSLSKPIIVSRQADTSVSIPNNTASRGFVVVTTAGSGASIGDLLYDNGLNYARPMQILTAIEGRTIAVTDSLTGGTISFEADSIYIWDADGGAWLKIGDVGNVTGAVRKICFDIDNTATQDSTNQIPAGNRVERCDVEITTQYSGGADIEVGTTADADAFQVVTDNKPQSVNKTYSVEQDTEVASASVVRVTVSGTPAAGAGRVCVWYSNPNG